MRGCLWEMNAHLRKLTNVSISVGQYSNAREVRSIYIFGKLGWQWDALRCRDASYSIWKPNEASPPPSGNLLCASSWPYGRTPHAITTLQVLAFCQPTLLQNPPELSKLKTRALIHLTNYPILNYKKPNFYKLFFKKYSKVPIGTIFFYILVLFRFPYTSI